MTRIVSFSDGCRFDAIDTWRAGEWVAFCTKLSGWYEGADVRTERVDRLGDGGFASDLWRKPRSLTLAFTEWLDSRAETVRRAREVSAVFQSGMASDGVITVNDPAVGTLRALGVELDGRPKVIHDETLCKVEWELPLIAPDPYLYGDYQRTTAVTGNAGQGLEYPLFDDQETGQTTGVLEYGELPPPPGELANNGNATAYPQVTVRGSFPNGFTLDVVSGGRVYGVTYRATVTPVSPVLVDFAGAITVGGADQSWALVRRDWGGVEPGGQMTVQLRALSAEGAGSAEVELCSTYL